MAAKYSDDVYINDLYTCREMTGPEVVEFIGHLSYGLHQLACLIIGDEDVIRIRRLITELQNEHRYIHNRMKDSEWCTYLSGSINEGFRFSSSDIDLMYIYRHVNVIHSPTIHHQYDDNTTVLLMESNNTKPGFVLMRLMGYAYDSDVLRSCVPYLSHTYVSSHMWREANPHRCPSTTIHGPCNSGVAGTTEYDQAYCLHSDTWPLMAYGCIQRLSSRQWPSLEVIKDIITGGVDFVPIHSKESKHEFLEWRMSFSVAEKKLIHAMNHTQFMCYGLLKIFLKEAINNVEDIKSILCSYYLKTAVLWEILNPSALWVPNNLFCCFWQCFRKLISWTENEYLPNFFIPENNMLTGKFQPGQKKILMDHLNMLHSEGYSCLLRCPSLRDVLIIVIYRPLTVYTLYEHNEEIRKCLYDIHTNSEISWLIHFCCNRNLQCLLNTAKVLLYQYSIDNSEFIQLAFGIWCMESMKKLANTYHCTISNKRNKDFYQKNRTILNVINRCRTDCSSHNIHLAVCLYRCGRHEDVINLIRKSKIKLQNPHLMYTYTGDIGIYRAAGGAHTPYPVMMSKYMAGRIELNYTTSIPELRLECRVANEHSAVTLYFPPLVIAELLRCLSCHHLGYHQLVRESVSDLHALVHYDDGYHIRDAERAISWQILGICQEMIGDFQGAYQSYYNAVQDQYSCIRPASRRRLEHLCST